MIVPPPIAEKLASRPDVASHYQNFPIAFFGDVVKYPKQAATIRRWLATRPRLAVFTGWKRTCKTSVGVYLTSCWLNGKLDRAWPGARAMDVVSTYSFKRTFNLQRVALIGGASFEHIEQVLLEEYRSMIPPSLVDRWYSPTRHSLQLAGGDTGGSRAVIRSYDQDLENWKSGQFQLVHLDEEPPWSVLLECLNRTSNTQGNIIITVAVDNADTAYLPDVVRSPKKTLGLEDKDFMHVQFGVEDVPDEIYPHDEKKRLFLQYDGTPWQDAVRKGGFAHTSMRWWPEFDPQIHVIKPFPIPPGVKKWRAIDPGVASPCGAVWAFLHPSNIIFFYREYYKTGTVIDQRCADIIELSGNTRIKRRDFWEEQQRKEVFEMTLLDHAEFKRDDRTGDSTDFEYIKAGLIVTPWTTLGQSARRDWMRKWLWVDKREKHFITHEPGAPRAYFFDDCVSLIWEAQRKAFKEAPNERSGVPERKIQNKDDHLMDCCEAIAVELSWMVQGREVI